MKGSLSEFMLSLHKLVKCATRNKQQKDRDVACAADRTKDRKKEREFSAECSGMIRVLSVSYKMRIIYDTKDV